jgi:organic radical activating enzyme
MSDSIFKELINSPYFCAYPFVQISTVPAGFMRPCCFYTDILKNDDGSGSNVDKNTFQDVWNNNNFRTIRTDMLNFKKISNCQQCHKEDSFGGDSMRKRSLREWTWRDDFKKTVLDTLKSNGVTESGVKFLELKPGNLCNLKCRMCNQFDSSKYATELKEIGAKFNASASAGQARLFEKSSFEYDFDLSKMADWTNNPAIWKSFETLASQVEILSFAGGEPSLIQDVYKSLKYCVENDLAKNITVYFATNFTQNLDKFAELAKAFKRFDFIASIDGHGEVQEYIRFPSSWTQVEKNFLQINDYCKKFKNINLMINLTVNIYNILSFTKLLSWLEQPDLRDGFREDPFNLNILMFPNYLSFDLLPLSLRSQAISRIKEFLDKSWICSEKSHIKSRVLQLINMLENRNFSEDSSYLKRLKEFWIYSKILDQHRHQKMQAVLPELYEEVKKTLEVHKVDLKDIYRVFQISSENL